MLRGQTLVTNKLSTTCKWCYSTLEANVKFCTQCGAELTRNKLEDRDKSITLVISFYIAFLVFAVISYFLLSEYPNHFYIDLGVEIGFAALVLFFSSLDYKKIRALYLLPKLDWKLWVFTFVFPIFSAVLVNIFVDSINGWLGVENNSNYYLEYIYYENPLLWSFIFVAVFPPIFEELAFRGFLFNVLRKISSDRLTIIATAFLFALVHFSFISFLWIFPFGLVLGYLRSKYETIWLGVIIHFIHNFSIIVFDYIKIHY